MSASEDSLKPPSSSSSAHTPPNRTQSQSHSPSAASYLAYPVSHVVSGIYRRLTEPTPSLPASKKPSLDPMSVSEVYNPPHRTASPFQPPPLTPLTLKAAGNPSHMLLTRSLAEEIRLLVPPRLQLLDTWQLAYSLDRDGSSLSTLYDKCREFSNKSQRAGYVLVVRDSSAGGPGGVVGGGGGSGGTVFGAYLTDPPHPASHYYGTGECFLWRASVLPSTPLLQVPTTATANDGREETDAAAGAGTSAVGQPPSLADNNDLLELAGLPLPPSADTTQIRGRSTTLRGEERSNDIDTNYDSSAMLRESPSRIEDDADTTRTTSKRRDSNSSRNSHGGILPSPTLQRHASYGTDDSGKDGSGVSGQQVAPANLATGASLYGSGTTSPERIRFKAFPYSGVNDYMMLCETGFLSVGGGDGHYGLWLDDSFEKGVSSSCPTFGNEPLSDEGTKFDVLGVEVWYIGS
ncbi:oxidation resistance protein 1 [Emergomyces pasteurianus Ep9510]|uniref:Oxidation resistance protein 1 n=1 Tax=Emergomyces pasteurianus Ep9510 TaxID=1447872 RepID=A0A1J9PHK0_9EURO|nr:oxidation resistance protein 1 [Emergomyces pasteurianus Ep9510]